MTDRRGIASGTIRVVACIAVLAALVVPAGCTAPAEVDESSGLTVPDAEGAGEWVNPDAPLSGIAGSDWFTAGAQDASATLTVERVRSLAPYALVRQADGGSVPAQSVLVQPEHLTLPDGTAFDAYTLRYADRIQLNIDPVGATLDVPTLLKSEVVPTTTGETHLWRAITVRGFAGAARMPAEQRWEDGTVNRMPAVLRWTEPAASGPPYVHYALVGDVTIEELQVIAAAMR